MAICSRAKYREITGDTTTSDADVDSALADAQEDLEEQTDRFYESATRTESLLLDKDGYVYPKALPVVSVSVPTVTTVDGNRVLIGSLINISEVVDTRVSVTYVGGYAAADLPFRLVKLVARMAYADIHFNPDTPSGATSVKVGDVAFSGSRLDPQGERYIRRGIRLWTHPSRRLEAY